MYQQIEIDFDVFKELTFRRVSPEMTENDVIRDLLGLGKGITNETHETVKSPWVGKGAVLPHGTELRMKYAGREYKAEISDGAFVYEGQLYKAPSPAAFAITSNPVNGWNYWECKLPGSVKWESIMKYRKK
ncbi:MAG: DUF2924 domain-containing protein [Acidobacteria bacterium]|nr:DUF2924 domain-containing protein [Acidobacteriota bacterium]